MAKWNSSPHPISDLKDWNAMGRLELRPSFQRKLVWNQAARIMLIDTILRQVPMPKMFLWNEVRADHTHRQVIDGQQRISAILDYLRDDFALDDPYEGPYQGMRFSELPKPVREGILQYRIDYNEALGFTEDEVREVYSRVNKYSLPLNRQELRRADFPGRFLDLATELSDDEFLEAGRVFSVAQRRRMGDVEFVSELLAGMLEGPQDKKGDLDYFYARYAQLSPEDEARIRTEFTTVIADMALIFDETKLPLAKCRFRQKSDLYSLFLSIHEYHKLGLTLEGRPLDPLRGDLHLLETHIAPESNIDILSEYAIKCVSQANTVASRNWRKIFLMRVLAGTYRGRRPDQTTTAIFQEILLQANPDGQAALFDICSSCGEAMHAHDDKRCEIDWPGGTTVFQMSNACWRASDCSTQH